MAKSAYPSVSELRQLLTVDASTGATRWKRRTPDMFAQVGRHTPERMCNVWNSRCAGKLAGKRVPTGYLYVRTYQRRVPAHWIVWLFHYGEWPKEQVDHINGVRDDNRIENLRLVSGAENNLNMKRPKNNTSGYIGVSFKKCAGKWHAYVNIRGKRTNLGYFETVDMAVAARRKAQEELGFHENHGR